MAWAATCMLHPLANYTFGVKDEDVERDATVVAKFTRLKSKYEAEGLRRSVAGILLVHQHRHPHVLLLQNKANFFKLPGGRLRPGEVEIEGLKRKLTRRLGLAGQESREWEIGEALATWTRPGFEPYQYPYVAPHVTKLKEIQRVFLVHLPKDAKFAVPRNYTLLAVPLFELYDNAQRYGQLISSIPHLVSKYNFVLL